LKNILFVCVENSNRSQMAQAFALIHGEGKVNAFSAGSNPSGKVNPKAVSAMKALGYDLSSHDSKSIEEYRDMDIDLVVGMGCGDACPWVPSNKQIDWDIPDPRHMEGEAFNQIRDLVQEKVKGLLSAI
jgi:arsenate reductase